MAQGDFTKQEGQRVYEILNELFEGLPKTRRMEYLGHLNDIGLFIYAAIQHASEEVTVVEETSDGAE